MIYVILGWLIYALLGIIVKSLKSEGIRYQQPGPIIPTFATAEQAKVLDEGYSEQRKRLMFAQGQWKYKDPPLCGSYYWTTNDWIKHIDSYDGWRP